MLTHGKLLIIVGIEWEYTAKLPLTAIVDTGTVIGNWVDRWQKCQCKHLK